MSDGEWRIWQYDTRDKPRCDVIPVRRADNRFDPTWALTNSSIQFVYIDGQQTFYPWTSIVRAEYDPPTNP